MNVAIIPAYNPDSKLIELAVSLYEKGLRNIIVVNDGSDERSKEIFELLGNYATVLTHHCNLGKGAAIKTALKHADNLKSLKGIVVLDADGQHRPEDAIRLLAELKNNESGLVLGVRRFDGRIPLRSLIGNTITRYVFRLCSGRWIMDTQTGLRAFSSDMISKLLDVKGDRYEYEMNVLLTCAKNRTLITEVPIATVYHDSGNSCSHFRTVVDSARIYGNLLAFSGASFLSFLLDYIVFTLFLGVVGCFLSESMALISGNIFARIISASFNYYLNCTYVFCYKGNKLQSLIRYAVLACLILALNTVILYGLSNFLGMYKLLAKLITEIMLFALSYTVQKLLIFSRNKPKGLRKIKVYKGEIK